MQLNELVPLLQASIAPVILISGVGLLILSMTNRLGRVIDRSRLIADALAKAAANQRGYLSEQLGVLSRRARLLRLAIILAAVSVLLTAVLIITVFLSLLFGSAKALLVVLLFVACMASLIGSLVAFILDLNLSLAALRTEITARQQP
jgi:hypothetical protein